MRAQFRRAGGSCSAQACADAAGYGSINKGAVSILQAFFQKKNRILLLRRAAILSPQPESNGRPAAYKTAALPTEL